MSPKEPKEIQAVISAAPSTQPVSPVTDMLRSAAALISGRITTMPIYTPFSATAPAAPSDAVSSAPLVSGTVSNSDAIFSAIVNGLNAAPSVQLPASYSGGTTTTTPGSSGSRGPLLLAVLLAAGLGLWYFKNKGGK